MSSALASWVSTAATLAASVGWFVQGGGNPYSMSSVPYYGWLVALYQTLRNLNHKRLSRRRSRRFAQEINAKMAEQRSLFAALEQGMEQCMTRDDAVAEFDKLHAGLVHQAALMSKAEAAIESLSARVDEVGKDLKTDVKGLREASNAQSRELSAQVYLVASQTQQLEASINAGHAAQTDRLDALDTILDDLRQGIQQNNERLDYLCDFVMSLQGQGAPAPAPRPAVELAQRLQSAH